MIDYKQNGVNIHVVQTSEFWERTRRIGTTQLIRCAWRFANGNGRRYKTGLSFAGFKMVSGQKNTRPGFGRTKFKSYQRSLFQNQNTPRTRQLQSNIALATKSHGPFSTQARGQYVGEFLELAHQGRETLKK